MLDIGLFVRIRRLHTVVLPVKAFAYGCIPGYPAASTFTRSNTNALYSIHAISIAHAMRTKRKEKMAMLQQPVILPMTASLL